MRSACLSAYLSPVVTRVMLAAASSNEAGTYSWQTTAVLFICVPLVHISVCLRVKVLTTLTRIHYLFFILVTLRYPFTVTKVPTGRGEWIRTTDLSVPNAVLCQAEPHPAICTIKGLYKPQCSA